MSTILVNHDQVYELLPMAECIRVLRETFGALARGQALLPLRSVVRLPGANIIGRMSAYMEPLACASFKVISVFPGNDGTACDSHPSFKQSSRPVSK